jgi:hypothetical protein
MDGGVVVFVGELGDQSVDGLADEGQPGVGVVVAGGRLVGAVCEFGIHGRVAAQQGAGAGLFEDGEHLLVERVALAGGVPARDDV